MIQTKPQSGIWWPFFLGSLISITSKYVLTYRGRHLWNPTNFAVSFLLLAAPGSVAILSHEWGNELWTVGVIWVIGLAVVARAKLIHITLSYAAAFLALAGLRCAITGASYLTEIGPITGPMYQLLMFFMLTDPRTTVSSRNGRLIVVVLIALLECALRLGNDFHQAWAAPFATAPAISRWPIGPIAMVTTCGASRRSSATGRCAARRFLRNASAPRSLALTEPGTNTSTRVFGAIQRGARRRPCGVRQGSGRARVLPHRERGPQASHRGRQPHLTSSERARPGARRDDQVVALPTPYAFEKPPRSRR